MESYLEQCARIPVGIEELEDFLLSPHDKICIAILAELAQDEGGYHRFLVDEKLWCKEVAGDARFAEQARNVRNEKDMNRTADLRTSQVSAIEVSDDTKKNILELDDAIAALRAENSIGAKESDSATRNSTKGTEEQKQGGSSSKRQSTYKKKSKRWCVGEVMQGRRMKWSRR